MNIGVAVDTGSSGLVDVLTYTVPDYLAEDVAAGACVLVPLGTRRVVGYVAETDVTTDIENLRDIITVIDTPIKLDQDLIDLAKWVSDEYFCSFSKTLLAMLPSVMQFSAKCYVVPGADSEGQILTPDQHQMFHMVKTAGECSLSELYDAFGKSKAGRLVRMLEKTGLLQRIWRLIAPEGKARSLKAVELVQPDLDPSELTEKQRAIWDFMLTAGRAVAVVELVNRHELSSSAANWLVRRGYLSETKVSYRRIPRFSALAIPDYALTRQQSDALEEVSASLETGGYHGILLHGVTASGKTEVYIRAIEQVLQQGKTAMVLLPEIALTTQVMDIFRSRFGEQVAVLHSALSAGERYDEWCRVRRGQARVVLGARSAVFAPLSDIGLIVVDEEHEPSYKQDNPPRYHCRDVANRRAVQSGCTIVFGSATPSIESYYRTRQGELHLLEMTARVAERPLPEIIIADMRKQYRKGKPTIFSDELKDRIRNRLDKKQQVILFQNRRAYSTFLLCRECGFVHRCPNCEVALKLHSAAKKLSCHHCDYEQPAPETCPECKGLKISKFGIGTEKVEEETINMFPEARVLRMDRDTTSRKGAHADILGGFRRGDADILVGTQMIAKGLDFPRVTLVGVISADTSLNMPDFRAPERTFQMLSQVSGRAGRGIDPGEVVVQTFDPDHYAVARATAHDYLGFYEEELKNRRELSYPPFSSQIFFISQDEDYAAAEKRIRAAHAALKRAIGLIGGGVELLDPLPAPISKLRGEYRWQLLARSPDRTALHASLRRALEDNPALLKDVAVDVDPMSMV